MDINCLYGILGLAGVNLGIVAMFLGYKVKVDKKHIYLEKNDYQQKERIKELEKKNGHEQHQIDELKGQVAILLKEKEQRK